MVSFTDSSLHSLPQISNLPFIILLPLFCLLDQSDYQNGYTSISLHNSHLCLHLHTRFNSNAFFFHTMTKICHFRFGSRARCSLSIAVSKNKTLNIKQAGSLKIQPYTKEITRMNHPYILNCITKCTHDWTEWVE